MTFSLDDFIERPYWQQQLILGSVFSCLGIIIYFFIFSSLLQQYDNLEKLTMGEQQKIKSIKERKNKIETDTNIKKQSNNIYAPQLYSNHFSLIEQELIYFIKETHSYLKKMTYFANTNVSAEYWQLIVKGEFINLFELVKKINNSSLLYDINELTLKKTKNKLILELKITPLKECNQ